ncbi:MAG TPA: AAA family ATPase [Streptosporangiaceae bacterium]|nr:AAA family ATPase [Streptosporangiaceae bacterium]
MSGSGHVIFLNGTSSSGKSSIAEELLHVLDRPYYHLSVDVINGLRSRQRSLELSPAELDATLRRMRAGFHATVAAMARAGNDLVVDYVLSERWRLPDLLRALAGVDVLFVGVRCPAAELARRERARGDRAVGQAASQLAQVHAHGCYDLEVDTSAQTPAECARAIAEFLPGWRRPGAFGRLREAGATPAP